MSDSWTRLIISDTHIGSANAKESALLDMLQNTEYDEIILAGDIIEFLRSPIFTKTSRDILSVINEKSKSIIYIVGNHDIAFSDLIGSNISNIRFLKRYEFNHYNRKFRIEHGDEYDSGLVTWRYAIEFVSFLQNMLERVFKIDLTTWHANRQIKKRKLRRIWDIVKWNPDADVFIMGHTHNPEVLIWVDKYENIKTYINSGDWIDNCTYVLIKDGQVRLRKHDWNDFDEDTITIS
tara:strand:+ start:875 stop:1582 length:708 start_codon:yes stop_codon:yes gene_type:complete